MIDLIFKTYNTIIFNTSILILFIPVTRGLSMERQARSDNVLSPRLAGTPGVVV